MGTQVFVIFVMVTIVFVLYRSGRVSGRLAYIQSYLFHPSLYVKVREQYPHLTDEQLDKVFDALRDYFYICNKAKKRMVAMPSQVVDVAWHEFILFTRNYEAFCKKSFGRYLHHTPTVAMKSPTHAEEGIKRAWRLACAKENIDPASPTRLPLLFAVDALLNIENGFKYSLNCKDKSSPNYADGYCAGHIGCASGCGGDSGDTSASGGFFDGFSGGSDCGGGGCGGD